jgi:cupin fold WbuC family metalloprotein
MPKLKKEEIYDKNKLMAFILKNKEYPSGIKFYNKDDDFIQVGTWNYKKGKRIEPHLHRIFNRVAKRTQETVFLKSGKIKSNIYNEKGKLLASVVLNTGDIIIYLAGGHDFEILEDNTQVLEVKNGPYPGKEKDKKYFNVKNN